MATTGTEVRRSPLRAGREKETTQRGGTEGAAEGRKTKKGREMP